MKISRADVPARTVDPALEIVPLHDGRNFRFDVALGQLHGAHGRITNRVSDRIYFILSGTFTVKVGENTYDAEAFDTFVIPADTPHGIDGNGEFLIITSPPFDPANESVTA